MVEFDVQLSKDFIPVIYHDFYVSISMKRKKQIEAMDMLEIPVKDLTLEQLHLLKVLISYDEVSYVMHFLAVLNIMVHLFFIFILYSIVIINIINFC